MTSSAIRATTSNKVSTTLAADRNLMFHTVAGNARLTTFG